MNHHIGPRRIYTSDWEFARSYRPKRTAFGVLLAVGAIVVTLIVGAMVLWLIVAGMLALWMMAKGARA